MNTSPPTRTVRLRRSAITSLFRRCGRLGEAGIEALRTTGDRVGADLLEAVDASPGTVPADEFWSRLDAALGEAGLGSISFRPAGRGMGAVSWRDPVDVPEQAQDAPRCHFTVGLLAGVLRRAAGRHVEVAEVRCGDGGPCRFIFGSAETIRHAASGSDSEDLGVAPTGTGGAPR